MYSKIRLLTYTLAMAAIFGSSRIEAENKPAASQYQPYQLNSGEYNGKPTGTFVAYKAKVQVPGAPWLRLFFGNVSLTQNCTVVVAVL